VDSAFSECFNVIWGT